MAAAVWPVGCGPQACPAALLSGQLVEVDGRLAVEAPDGTVVAVDWSNYAIRREGEDIVVTDTWGIATLAREGDEVNLGGGHVQVGGRDGPFKVCGQVEVVGS